MPETNRVILEQGRENAVQDNLNRCEQCTPVGVVVGNNAPLRWQNARPHISERTKTDYGILEIRCKLVRGQHSGPVTFIRLHPPRGLKPIVYWRTHWEDVLLFLCVAVVYVRLQAWQEKSPILLTPDRQSARTPQEG